MYAQRFDDGPRFRVGSMGVALAVNGGVIAALLFAGPDLVRIAPKPPITLIDIAPDPRPSDPPPDPKPRVPNERPNPRPTVAVADPRIAAVVEPFEITTGGGGDIAGPGVGSAVEAAVPLVEPAFVAAAVDPRYADAMQPAYPDAQRDAGVEGSVRLRVTIGADGRVRHVDQLDGDSALLRAAARHALARWRFRPATRGGVPVESMKVMTVRFKLKA